MLHFSERLACWQSPASAPSSSPNRFFGRPVHDKCITEFHTDNESLLKRHKIVHGTRVAFAYHRLKSDDDIIRAIEDLESRIPRQSPITGSKVIHELSWPAQLNGRADELATEAIITQLRSYADDKCLVTDEAVPTVDSVLDRRQQINVHKP
jgi:hypothetical protein